MAYNLQSLITTLEQILNPEQTRCFIDHNKPQLQSLLKHAAALQQILENPSFPKTENLESQIRDAAHEAEDIIESHMADQVRSSPEGMKFTFTTPGLDKVKQELESLTEQVEKLVGGKNMSSGSSSSGATFSTSKSVVVGVDEDLMQLKDRLTGMERKLEIIPIVGMGGIGKTTLAQKLYHDPLIVEHFEFRAWTTISQEYNMKSILSSLLCCIHGKEFDAKHKEKESDALRDLLYRSLCGRRFMIVLDDIWSTKFWDEIRVYLPDNNNGSRIVITSRGSEVAKYADSRSLEHRVQLLNQSRSWDLLRQIVFGEEDCPDGALQGIGEMIASGCGGLPLAISVIGGLLSKVERSQDVWWNIRNNIRATIVESDEHDQPFSNILSLSYNHLPNHLKPCFLYMGVFPEDYVIKTSRLLRIWVAEGFFSSKGDKSLEEQAKDCLKALVERNLLSERHYKYGKEKRYNMHDLLRDLCIKKAEEENFLHAAEVTFNNLRRAYLHRSHETRNVRASAESNMSLARSLICIGYMSHDEFPFHKFFMLRLLRVLDLKEMFFEYFPREIYELVNLRYLAINSYSLPVGISRLHNLQTLINARLFSIDDPSEIWKLPELRNLKLNRHILFRRDAYIRGIVHHEKLQVVSLVMLNRSLIESGFFECIPNIRKLDLNYDPTGEPVAVDLSHLHKLEVLTCEYDQRGSLSLPGVRFPDSLRKLSLFRCENLHGLLRTLCALPNLEVLKLKDFEIEGDEWKAAEGDVFSSLQFLYLKHTDMERWTADETNFPRLRHLRLKRCYRLQEIPSGFGEIATLQSIELEDCNGSVIASARHIQEVQQSDYDNYDLQLLIHETEDTDRE